MRKLFVLFILVLGATQVSEALASEGQTYEVRPRDRLERVARTYGVTVGEIISANSPRAFIRECVGERELTLRNGETITVCRRVHYGLIVGTTLTIPTPRLLVESENVRLGAENTATRAELVRANEARDSLTRERDALSGERDRLMEEQARLAEVNAKLAEMNAAMAEKNNEFVGRYSEARAAADANSANREVSKTESRETTVIIVVVGSLVVVVFAIVFVWWSRQPLRHLERDRAHLEVTRQSLVGEAQELVDRRRTAEAGEQDARLARDKEQAVQKSLRDQLTRWEEDWRVRNDRQNARQREQSDLAISLEGRETVCRIREEKVERRTAEIDAWQKRLDEEAKEFAGKQHGVEELRVSLNAQRARQDRADIEQDKREEDLAKGFSDLNILRQRLNDQLDARRQVLDEKESEIDGKVRMFDQDILPQLTTFADREAALHKREEVVANREQAAARLEADLGLRVEEFQEAKADLERREGSLHVGEQELERRQVELANERAGFDQEMAAAREAFKQEMAAARAAFETAMQEARAAHAVEVASAKRTIQQARRKEAITQELNRREAALGDRDVALQRREEAVAASEEAARHLAEREEAVRQREEAVRQREERERALAGVPKSKLPRRPTVPAPFAPPPVNGVGGDGPDGAGDDSPTAVVLPELPEGDVDPSATTYVDAPGSEPAMDVSKCLCPVCNHEVLFGKLDEHLAQAHPEYSASRDAGQTGSHIPVTAEPSAYDTGLQILVADKPPPHSESSFWCSLCKRDIPMDQMEEHQGLHYGQKKPGPLGQA